MYPGEIQAKALFTGVGLLKVCKLIDESMTPVAQPVRRIPFEIREKVDKKFDLLLELDIRKYQMCLQDESHFWWFFLRAMGTLGCAWTYVVQTKQSSVKDTRFQRWRSFYTI